MSQTENVDVEDVQSPMLDANEALKNGDPQTALAKLQEAKRRCGILAREGGGGDE